MSNKTKSNRELNIEYINRLRPKFTIEEAVKKEYLEIIRDNYRMTHKFGTFLITDLEYRSYQEPKKSRDVTNIYVKLGNKFQLVTMQDLKYIIYSHFPDSIHCDLTGLNEIKFQIKINNIIDDVSRIHYLNNPPESECNLYNINKLHYLNNPPESECNLDNVIYLKK